MNEETISQLETLHNKIYKETEEYGRTQFVSRIADLEHNWNELKKWLEGNIKLLDDVYLGENKNNYSEDMILDMSSRKWGYKNTLDKMKWLEEWGNNE